MHKGHAREVPKVAGKEGRQSCAGKVRNLATEPDPNPAGKGNKGAQGRQKVRSPRSNQPRLGTEPAMGQGKARIPKGVQG